MPGIRSSSTWISYALLLVLLPACVSADKYMRLEHEYATLEDQLLFAQEQLAQAEAALADGSMTEEDVARLQQELARLQAEKDELAARYADIESRGVDGFDTFREGNMMGFRGESDVFFASGQDALTAEGKRALDALISRELSRNEGPIQVVGHTDTDPVVKTKDKYPRGNIELGMNRALSVQQYLIDHGIDASRISIASWGEHKPLEPGKGSEAKARNRRVEIMVAL